METVYVNERVLWDYACEGEDLEDVLDRFGLVPTEQKNFYCVEA